MKSIYILILFLCVFKIPVEGQYHKDTLENWDVTTYWTDFEANNWMFVEIDSTQPNNLWQIGSPHKEKFNTPIFGHYSLVTDTVNSITFSNQSSFTFKYERPDWIELIDGVSFIFSSRIDLDSLSGLLVELSYDKGQTWFTLWEENPHSEEYSIMVAHPKFYNLPSGIEVLSFDDTINTGFGFERNYKCTWQDAGEIQSIFLKITFINEGIGNHIDGIMFDNIYVTFHHWCEFITVKENKCINSSKVVPNPIETYGRFILPGVDLQRVQLIIFNSVGQKIFNNPRIEINDFNIGNLNLNEGMYGYQIVANNGIIYNGKFIINK